jgi:hypothetical protein
MKSADALHEFKRFLKKGGANVEALSVRQGIDAMIEFYRSTRADDCDLDRDGDMLLFQWGTYDWGQGRRSELDITRQFIPAGREDEDIWQLSLTFLFDPNLNANENRWCMSPTELDDFVAFVGSRAAYLATADGTPVAVELDFEAV